MKVIASISQTSQRFITHPNFSLVFFISVCCILPIYFGSAVTMFACASVMTAFVAVLPEQFRSRNGSSSTATCLVTAMWIAVVVLTAMTLVGQIL